MQYTLADREKQVIDQALAAADQQHQGSAQPFDARALLHNTHHRSAPLWLYPCHAVLLRHQFLDGWPKDTAAKVLRASWLQFSPEHHAGSATLPAVSPGRIAALALGCLPDEWPGAAQPADLQESLLVHLFTGISDSATPPRADQHLDLTQLLVAPSATAEHNGRLARLELAVAPPRADALQPPQPSLVRAPGALLLQLDDDFAEGVLRLKRLLRCVLKPDAPSVAWNLRPLPHADLPHPPALGGTDGHSATAALYLLRDHLLPEFNDPASQLHDCEPATLTITAGLDGPLADADRQAPFTWPNLVRVGDVDDKFAALQQLPTGRTVTHRYVAHDQHSNAAGLHAGKTLDLAALVARIAEECNGGLDTDARTLHRHLVTSDAAIDDMDLLERVAWRRELPRSIKAYLVWRYARRDSGSQQRARQAHGAPAPSRCWSAWGRWPLPC